MTQAAAAVSCYATEVRRLAARARREDRERAHALLEAGSACSVELGEEAGIEATLTCLERHLKALGERL